MSKEIKEAILKDLIQQMHRKMAAKGESKSAMEIAMLDGAKEGPGPIEAMATGEESEESEGDESSELMEALKQFLKGDTKPPEAKGITIEAVSAGAEPLPKGKPSEKRPSEAKEPSKGSAIPVEGTSMMLKEFLKSKKMKKFA